MWLARLGVAASVALLVVAAVRLVAAAGIAPRWSVNQDPVRASTTGRPVRPVEVIDPRSATRGRPVTDFDGAAAEPVDVDPSGESKVVTTALETPDAVDPAGVAGSGRPAVIDFETFPGGRASCSPCAVSDEWETLGLVVSFRSWTADSRRPHVLDGRDYLPAGSDARVLGPPFREGRGLEVGVIRLDFPDRPRSVRFFVFGPDIVPDFDITAWSGRRIVTAAVGRSVGRRYDIAGRGMFREEVVNVRVEEGIDRISIDGWGPPGHLVFVDRLEIVP